MNIQKLTFVFYSSRIVGKQMPFYAINLDLHLNFSALDFEHSLTNHDLLSFAKWIYAVANARLYNLRAHQGALYLNKLETVSKQDIFLHIFSSSSTNANCVTQMNDCKATTTRFDETKKIKQIIVFLCVTSLDEADKFFFLLLDIGLQNGIQNKLMHLTE